MHNQTPTLKALEAALKLLPQIDIALAKCALRRADIEVDITRAKWTGEKGRDKIVRLVAKQDAILQEEFRLRAEWLRICTEAGIDPDSFTSPK